MIPFIFIPLPRNEVPSPSPSSRKNLESLVGELEKTVASLRKQVKLCFGICLLWRLEQDLAICSLCALQSHEQPSDPRELTGSEEVELGEEMESSSVSSNPYNCRIKYKFEAQ